uniref:Uncharacterized protein n=1 Tax=Arsenophonus nasoniae TaxID=638 RepID=D2U0S7_9GAMM|nr:conserved hypothetical proteins [Arsenophonus nasoniae]
MNHDYFPLFSNEKIEISKIFFLLKKREYASLTLHIPFWFFPDIGQFASQN